MTDEEQKRIVNLLRWYADRMVKQLSSPTLRAAANEIERLQRELNSTLGLLYQESEHRAEQDKRIERLEKDLEALRRM
jgi:predicted TIM-barrel fold metal-dependent hydrolase